MGEKSTVLVPGDQLTAEHELLSITELVLIQKMKFFILGNSEIPLRATGKVSKRWHSNQHTLC